MLSKGGGAPAAPATASSSAAAAGGVAPAVTTDTRRQPGAAPAPSPLPFPPPAPAQRRPAAPQPQQSDPARHTVGQPRSSVSPAALPPALPAGAQQPRPPHQRQLQPPHLAPSPPHPPAPHLMPTPAPPQHMQPPQQQEQRQRQQGHSPPANPQRDTTWQAVARPQQAVHPHQAPPSAGAFSLSHYLPQTGQQACCALPRHVLDRRFASTCLPTAVNAPPGHLSSCRVHLHPALRAARLQPLVACTPTTAGGLYECAPVCGGDADRAPQEQQQRVQWRQRP